MTTSTSRQRGYALMIVLVVLMLIGMAVGSLATLLEATIAEGRKTTSTIRADLACGSALDLSGRTITSALTADPSLGTTDLLAMLCDLGPCTVVGGVTLPTFLAPPGSSMEHFAIAYSSTKGRTTRTIPTGPFADRVAVEQSLMVTVALRDNVTKRPCAASDRYLVPSLPLTSVALFGTADKTRWKPPLAVRRVNDGAPSRAHLNGNKSGTQISSSDFVLPGPQFAGDQQPIDLIGSTRGSDQILAPSVGTPAMSAKQSSLARSLRWLVEPPRSSDSDGLTHSRLAQVADVVIVDGVWYDHRDKTKPWPGTPIWSDHGGDNVDHVVPATNIVASTAKIGQGDFGFAAGEVPTLYSWYDRAAPTTTIAPQAGGVVSYGPLFVQTTTTSCNSDADCGSLECFRPTSSAGTCQHVGPGVWPSPLAACGGVDLKQFSDCPNPGDALIDGTRGGFRDKGRNIWPINIDLETLATAVTSTDKHELGAVLGGPAFFNGVVYVTSRFPGATLPKPDLVDFLDAVGPPPFCNSMVLGVPGICIALANLSNQPRSSNTVPVPLCGPHALSTSFGAADCTKSGRPNAVRVYNGTRLPAGAFPRGLTIATDLPLYVQGDLNRVQAGTPPPPHVKVSVVADRVTFLSRGWRDANHPWNGPTLSSPPPTGTMVVEASIVSGLPVHGGDTHDVADLFRTPQTFLPNHFVLRGHLSAAFNSELDDRDDVDDRVNEGLRWLPDYHLENPGFQPPGMPLLTLPPTARWRQR